MVLRPRAWWKGVPVEKAAVVAHIEHVLEELPLHTSNTPPVAYAKLQQASPPPVGPLSRRLSTALLTKSAGPYRPELAGPLGATPATQAVYGAGAQINFLMCAETLIMLCAARLRWAGPRAQRPQRSRQRRRQVPPPWPAASVTLRRGAPWGAPDRVRPQVPSPWPAASATLLLVPYGAPPLGRGHMPQECVRERSRTLPCSSEG